jgi:hypothetical protein
MKSIPFDLKKRTPASTSSDAEIVRPESPAYRLKSRLYAGVSLITSLAMVDKVELVIDKFAISDAESPMKDALACALAANSSSGERSGFGVRSKGGKFCVDVEAAERPCRLTLPAFTGVEVVIVQGEKCDNRDVVSSSNVADNAGLRARFLDLALEGGVPGAPAGTVTTILQL